MVGVHVQCAGGTQRRAALGLGYGTIRGDKNASGAALHSLAGQKMNLPPSPLPIGRCFAEKEEEVKAKAARESKGTQTTPNEA